MAQPRPSLRSIAAATGVSTMTVSRALRGQPGVSTALRDRIRHEAVGLGYRPNPLVQALMEQVRVGRVRAGTTVIALLLPQATNADWGREAWIRRMVAGARARAEGGGYKLEEMRWPAPGLSAHRLDQILGARGIRGLVVGPLAQPGSSLDLDWSRYSCAAVGASLAAPRLHRVRHHAFHSVQEAVRRLRAAGRQRLGLVLSHASSARVARLWEGGFLLATAGDGPSSAPLLRREELDPDSYAAWLRSERPDAVLVLDPRVLAWTRALGCAVPHDVAIVSLNRAAGAEDLAGIDQEMDAIGAAAIDLVVEQLLRNECGLPARPKDVLVEGRWVDGPTCPLSG